MRIKIQCNERFYCSVGASGFFKTKMTESPRRNIFEMKRSFGTGFDFFLPLPVFGISVHISFTSSNTMLQWLKKSSLIKCWVTKYRCFDQKSYFDIILNSKIDLLEFELKTRYILLNFVFKNQSLTKFCARKLVFYNKFELNNHFLNWILNSKIRILVNFEQKNDFSQFWAQQSNQKAVLINFHDFKCNCISDELIYFKKTSYS